MASNVFCGLSVQQEVHQCTCTLCGGLRVVVVGSRVANSRRARTRGEQFREMRVSSSCLRAAQVCAARGLRCAPLRGFSGKVSSTFFTKEHEYARVEGSTAVCGVSNYAQAALGDVVFVSLPQVGAVFKKGCVGMRRRRRRGGARVRTCVLPHRFLAVPSSRRAARSWPPWRASRRRRTFTRRSAAPWPPSTQPCRTRPCVAPTSEAPPFLCVACLVASAALHRRAPHLERRRPRRSPTAASPALLPQALVNSAAESDAWFVKLTLGPGADAETKTLLDAKAYKAHCDADAASH